MFPNSIAITAILTMPLLHYIVLLVLLFIVRNLTRQKNTCKYMNLNPDTLIPKGIFREAVKYIIV